MRMKNSIIKYTIAFLLLVNILLCLTSCRQTYVENTTFAMGSLVSYKIFTDDKTASDNIVNAINEAIAESENALSATKSTAEIYALNENGTIYASDYLKKTLQETKIVSEILNNVVDFSIGRVTDLWGFSTDNPKLPEQKQISDALKTVGADNIIIADSSNKITINNNCAIDMGAFGKGAACDNIFNKIKNLKTPVILSFGGTVFAFGNQKHSDKWTVGIRNPFDNENSYYGTVSVSPKSQKNAVFISTSGSYEKVFEKNGKSYHHILDPKTGFPVKTNLVSVSVIAVSGIQADALSTYCFINGLNDETLSKLSVFDADAIFVFDNKEYYCTDGIADSFKCTNSDFTFTAYEKNS